MNFYTSSTTHMNFHIHKPDANYANLDNNTIIASSITGAKTGQLRWLAKVRWTIGTVHAYPRPSNRQRDQIGRAHV